MNRAALLTALSTVTDLEEIVTPKTAGNSFAVKPDGLYYRPAAQDNEYKVGKEAATQALRHVPGLSAAAIKEWPTDLLMEPMNWWYQNGDGDVRMLANGQGEVVSFTKAANSGINNPIRSLEAIEDALDEKGIDTDDLYYDKVRVTLDKVAFAVVTHEKNGEVKVGDVMDAGIMFFGSPTGEAYTEVSPYLNRLLCTNGMISPVHMGRWSHRGGDGGSIYDWTKEMTLGSWDAIDGELDSLRALTQIDVPDDAIHTVLADLFERHHVNANLRQAVAEAAVIEADGTLFGLSQAFNRAANNEQDIQAMRHLLMVTGDVAHQTERCSTCLRARN
jgi:hypothetical protein